MATSQRTFLMFLRSKKEEKRGLSALVDHSLHSYRGQHRRDSVSYYFPLNPIGSKAAAILLTPLSVASKLNCAAAFLVSCISTLMPNELRYFLVSGDMGYVEAPNPSINMSTYSVRIHYTNTKQAKHIIPGFGHTRSRTPQASFSTTHCPLWLIMRPLPIPSLGTLASQGLQLKASPATKRHPDPPPTFRPLSR